jgi:hypothetical protein
MSSVPESTLGDEQLVRYLLGLLPEEEAERLDEASVVDDETAARLRMAEDDLIDAYVGRALSGEVLARFESYYLASPLRREKVRFAENLRRSLDAAVARASTSAAVEPALERRQSGGSERPAGWFAWLSGWRVGSVWMLPVAATVALVLAGAFWFEDVRLRRELSEAQSLSATLEGQLELLLKTTPGGSSPSTDGDRGGTKTLPAMAIVLPPVTRSAAGPIATVSLAPEATRLTLELQLDSNESSGYQVALKDPGTNQIVWRSGRLAAVSHGDRVTVTVDVPAHDLKAQHYAVELSGQDAGERQHIVGTYTVQLQRN